MLMVNNDRTVKTLPNAQATTDTYLKNTVYINFDRTGLFSGRIITPMLTHREENDQSNFKTPNVLFYTDKRVPWYITAERGTSTGGIKTILLQDNVKLYQPPQAHLPETTILTPSLTINPQTHFAHTNDAVDIFRPNSKLTGVGMNANFKTNEMTILSKTRSIYQPDPTMAKEKKHAV